MVYLCALLDFAEFLDLTLSDVGCCIELVYTPIRKDGLRGASVSIISPVISPGIKFNLRNIIISKIIYQLC